MKSISISIEKFHKRYRENYRFIYDSYDRVAGYREAVDAFDAFAHTENGAALIQEFARYHRDCITSDREAAAFMFTLSDFMD